MKKIIVTTIVMVFLSLVGLMIARASNPLTGTTEQLLIPVLQVTPNPGMFDATFVGQTSDLFFTFENIGSDPIYVTNITFTNPVFSIDYTAFTIQPGESGDLPVHFTPPSVGYFQGIMQIYSNDPVNNPYDVQCNGAGITQLNMGWEWIETGFNYILMDIEFPGGQNQIGYSVGQSLTYNGVGIVIKTTDGGDTWTQMTPDGIPGLEGMSFVDTQTGYAVGWNGYVIKTTDGGNTWDTLEVTSQMWELSDIEFSDADHGVLIDYYGTYVTDDGGLTWVPANGMSIMPYELDFASPNVIFAIGGGGICKSIDGGYNWTESWAQPYSLLLGVDFLNEQRGLVVGDYGVILQTNDGGNTWDLTQPVGDQLLRSAFIWDQDTAWIAGTPEMVYKTVDGGLNWEFGYNSNGQKAIYRITFTDNYTGFMCGGSGGKVWRKQGINGPILSISPNIVSFPDTYVGQTSSFNVTFANNGNEPLNVTNITFTDPEFSIDYTSFTIQPGESGELPVNFTPTSTGNKQAVMQVFSNDLYNNPYEVQLSGKGVVETNMGWQWIQTGFNYILMDIEFPEGQNQIGYSIGQSLTYNGVGIVIKTTDSGNTWTQMTPDGIPGLEAMSFLDMQTGYAAGWDGYVIKTTNGGNTWDTITVGIGLWEINDIEFYDYNHGIIIEHTNVYITDDGGDTWVLGSTLLKPGFKVEYLNQNTLIVAANENYIFKSLDGGYTWTTKYTGIIGQLMLGVNFLDENYGMAVGDYGYILTTHDGGETWTPDTQVGDQLLHSVYIWDQDTAWIAGTPEMVYKTVDGGLNWNFGYNSNGQKAFYKVTFTDNYTGFICGGSGGIVLRKEGLPEIPAIVASTSNIVFNPVEVGQSETEVFTISNAGFGNLEISDITTTSNVFSVNLTNAIISPGESQEIEVTFSPTEAGIFQATLHILSNDPDQPNLEIQLQGEGYMYTPAISVTPEQIIFPDTYVGNSSTGNITISNIGSAVLSVTGISSTNNVFSASPSIFNIQPGLNQTVTVTFTPDDDQLFEGFLQISNNDPQNPLAEVALSGIGLMAYPQITIQPSLIDFDTVLVNETGTAILTINNIGIANLTVSNIVSSNPVFDVNLTTFILEPNQSQEVIVSFTPVEQMQYSGLLSISSNDPGNPTLQVNLYGYGDIETAIDQFVLKQGGIIVYPNPWIDELMIESESEILKVLVLNNEGKIIASKKLQHVNKCKVELSGQPYGFYLVRMETINGWMDFKTIKR